MSEKRHPPPTSLASASDKPSVEDGAWRDLLAHVRTMFDDLLRDLAKPTNARGKRYWMLAQLSLNHLPTRIQDAVECAMVEVVKSRDPWDKLGLGLQRTLDECGQGRRRPRTWAMMRVEYLDGKSFGIDDVQEAWGRITRAVLAAGPLLQNERSPVDDDGLREELLELLDRAETHRDNRDIGWLANLGRNATPSYGVSREMIIEYFKRRWPQIPYERLERAMRQLERDGVIYQFEQPASIGALPISCWRLVPATASPEPRPVVPPVVRPNPIPPPSRRATATIVAEQDNKQTKASTKDGKEIPIRATRAHSQYKMASDALGDPNVEDRVAYDHVKVTIENEGEGEQLPDFDTWTRNLRTYRQATDQQKNNPRAGRTSRSVARSKDL